LAGALATGSAAADASATAGLIGAASPWVGVTSQRLDFSESPRLASPIKGYQHAMSATAPPPTRVIEDDDGDPKVPWPGPG